jgi:hypothetical protein
MNGPSERKTSNGSKPFERTRNGSTAAFCAAPIPCSSCTTPSSPVVQDYCLSSAPTFSPTPLSGLVMIPRGEPLALLPPGRREVLGGLLECPSTFRNYTQTESRFRALLTEGSIQVLFYCEGFDRLVEVSA